MAKRSGVMLYFESWKPIMQLSDDDVVQLLRAALDYGETGREPSGIKANVYLNALWSQIRATINRDEARYDERCRKNRYNVYRRDTKRQGREPLEYEDWCAEIDDYRPITDDNQSISMDNDTNQLQPESQSINPNPNPNKQTERGKPPRAPRSIPPTVEQVEEYCRERGNNVDAQKFVDHYTANGWKVGKNPMKDWKAAVRTWEKTSKPAAGGKHYDYSYTEDSL